MKYFQFQTMFFFWSMGKVALDQESKLCHWEVPLQWYLSKYQWWKCESGLLEWRMAFVWKLSGSNNYHPIHLINNFNHSTHFLPKIWWWAWIFEMCQWSIIWRRLCFGLRLWVCGLPKWCNDLHPIWMGETKRWANYSTYELRKTRCHYCWRYRIS